MPAYRLTDAGKRLWHGYIGITLCEPASVDEFIERFLMGEPGNFAATCFRCGQDRRLILGVYCMGCVKQSWYKS